MSTHLLSGAPRLKRLMRSSALVLCAFASVPALAQTVPDEIVVTAQKRAQPLSKTPVSVAVITGAAMQRANVYDLKDAQILTSSLLITSTANEAQTTARLRGVGTVGDNPGLESSVGVVIDGVVRARTATAMGDLGSVERIEILKGPQTSLFGKGASAGVINIVTQLPSFTPSAVLDLTAGEHGTLGAAAFLTGPLGAKLAGSVAVVKRERDGQYNVHTGDGPRTQTTDNNQDYYALRGQLLITPNDTARIRVIADYADRDEYCCTGVMIARATGPSAWIDLLSADEGVSPAVNPKARQAWSNRSTAQKITDAGLSAETTVKVADAVTLTTITAGRHYDHTNGYDADFSSADMYYREPDGGFGTRYTTLSQELRLSGTGEKLDWLAGVYVDSEDLIRKDQSLYGADYEPYVGLLLSAGANINRVSQLTGLPVGTSFVAGQGANDLHQQHDRNIAAFGNAQWRLTPAVSVVAGLRLNRQQKTLISHYTTSDNGKACAAAQALGSPSLGVLCQSFANPAFSNLTLGQKREDEATTGTLKLTWQATPKLMSYVSYARGWKGGGFNLDREQTATFAVDPDTSFAPESVDAYELGLKGRFGRLSLETALFDQSFSHFQLNTFLGTTFLVTSIPHLHSKGLELEGRYALSELGLTLGGGMTYNESQFGHQAVTGLPLLAGSAAAFAPRWSAASQIDYVKAIGELELDANLSARFNSKYNTGSDLAPIKIQAAYTLLNGAIGLGKPDGSLRLELWGTNLTDVLYYQVAFSAPFQAGTYHAFTGQPRTVGLRLHLKR
jgi:iron complex outermembrane recepter protein